MKSPEGSEHAATAEAEMTANEVESVKRRNEGEVQRAGFPEVDGQFPSDNDELSSRGGVSTSRDFRRIIFHRASVSAEIPVFG